MQSNLIRKGICECTHEPDCDGGLEGYVKGTEYEYEYRRPIALKGGEYYRIYHSSAYYETCGPLVFKRHFKELT